MATQKTPPSKEIVELQRRVKQLESHVAMLLRYNKHLNSDVLDLRAEVDNLRHKLRG